MLSTFSPSQTGAGEEDPFNNLERYIEEIERILAVGDGNSEEETQEFVVDANCATTEEKVEPLERRLPRVSDDSMYYF